MTLVGELLASFNTHDATRLIALTRHSERIFLYDQGRSIQQWLSGADELTSIDIGASVVSSFAVSSDGAMIFVSFHFLNVIKAWSTATAALIWEHPCATEIDFVCVAHDELVAALRTDGLLFLRICDGTVVRTIRRDIHRRFKGLIAVE